MLVTPPVDLPVELEMAKAQCRIDDEDNDPYVEALLAAAVSMLDGRTGVLGRALMPQTWRLETRHPDHHRALRLRLPPVISVTSVRYYAGGVLTTLDPSLWRLGAVGQEDAVRLHCAAPIADHREDAWQVVFQAGYADADAVPAAIKHAILLLVSHLNENREAVVGVDNRDSSAPLPLGVDALLMPFRVLAI